MLEHLCNERKEKKSLQEVKVDNYKFTADLSCCSLGSCHKLPSSRDDVASDARATDCFHMSSAYSAHSIALQDIKVDKGKCSAVLPTSAPLSDQQGHLHAGCYCSLVDLISTTALAAADKRPAVTVTISVDFYAPLAIGEDLEVESHMVKAGKTLTFAEVNFRYA